MPVLTSLYRSDRVAITEYLCDQAPGAPVVEEAAHVDEFVFVVDGLYSRHSHDGRAMLDRSRVGVFCKARPYCIEHPAGCGDRSIIVAFGPADLAAAGGREPDAAGSLLGALPGVLSASAPILGGIARLVGRTRDAAADDLSIDEEALALLSCLFDTAAAKPRTVRIPASAHADDAAAVIAPRFRDRLSLQSIADAVGLSPYHLCRVFRRATGMTIHGYLTTLRMSEAALRLGDYRHDLTGLALELGYAGHSHFSATFRRFYGVTPSDMLAGARVAGGSASTASPPA